MIFNFFLALWGQYRRFLSRFVYSFVLAALSVLLVACVWRDGGGGSSSWPPARGSRMVL